MDKDDTLLDGMTDAVGMLLLGAVILWAFRLLIIGYVYLSAICWAICSELIWPCLRRMFKEIGIALLRTYNRLTSS